MSHLLVMVSLCPAAKTVLRDSRPARRKAGKIMVEQWEGGLIRQEDELQMLYPAEVLLERNLGSRRCCRRGIHAW